MPEQWILKGGRDDKYILYIEAYALDYIRKKENVSGLFLYGTRQAGDRERLLVYGVSHTLQDSDLFAPYETINGLQVRREHYEEETEAICFEIEEPEGIYKIKGYYIFYEDNPVMKQWLIREQGYAPTPVLEACERMADPGQGKRKRDRKGTAERVIDFGLIAILLALLSVVIDTLNSPIKMNEFVEHLQQIQKMLKR